MFCFSTFWSQPSILKTHEKGPKRPKSTSLFLSISSSFFSSLSLTLDSISLGSLCVSSLPTQHTTRRRVRRLQPPIVTCNATARYSSTSSSRPCPQDARSGLVSRTQNRLPRPQLSTPATPIRSGHLLRPPWWASFFFSNTHSDFFPKYLDFEISLNSHFSAFPPSSSPWPPRHRPHRQSRLISCYVRRPDDTKLQLRREERTLLLLSRS